jgi:hypothetical protein
MNKPILTLPCKMNLSDLSVNNKGYHCTSCDKTLRDFRNSSPEEINSSIKHSSQAVCGIFNKDQVASKVSFLSLPLWNARVSLSLLGVLGFIGSATVSCEADAPTIHEKKQNAFNILKFPMRFKGTVTDKSSFKIIPNAELKIIQNGKIIHIEKTDAQGKFDFLLQKSELSNETFDLVFKSTDFVNDTLNNLSFEEAKTKSIQLSLQAVNIDDSKECRTTIMVGDVACEPLDGATAPGQITAGVPMIEEVPPSALEVGKIIRPINRK